MQNIKLDVKLDKKAVVSLVVYGICIIEIFFAIPLQVRKFSSLRHKENSLRKKVTQAEKDLSLKDKIAGSKEKIKLDIVNLESSLATSQDISSVLAFVSQKAKESAVDILEIAQSPPKLYKKIAGVNIYALPIAVKAKANFHNFCRCLNVLQSGFYFLGIDSFSISREESSCEVKFVITALFRG